MINKAKTIKKKRERKPKKEKRTPKKRGRKPTSKLVKLNKKNILKNDENCIIAHIPLKINEINDESLKSMSNELSFDSMYDKNFNNKYIQKLEIQVKEMKQEIKILKNKKTDIVINSNYNIIKLKNLIISENLKDIKKTNLCCWWCSSQFDNIPFFLPNKYENKKFFVYGIFCSPNCTLAYNIDINDNKVWERHSLIYLLYNNITCENLRIKLFPAPPRQNLKKFGGNLTIEEFRIKSTIIKNSRFIIHPMVPIKTLIEESYQDRNQYKWNNNDLKSNRYHKLMENIQLRKSKVNENSLEKTMNFKKIKF